MKNYYFEKSLNLLDHEITEIATRFKILPEFYIKKSNFQVKIEDYVTLMLSHHVVFVNEEGEIVIPAVNYDVLREIVDAFSTSEDWDKTFYVSWKDCAETAYAEALLNQHFHYLTAYYNDMKDKTGTIPVFVPRDVFLKDEKNHSRFVPSCDYQVITVANDAIFIDIIRQYLYTVARPDGIKETMAKILTFFKDNGVLDFFDLDKIKSFEMKCLVWEILDKVPSNENDFVRFMVYKATDDPMVIKNTDTIAQIHQYCQTCGKEVFHYFSQIPWTDLAKCFNRYKPLFLAFKKATDMKPVINKISKLSKTLHVPMNDISVKNMTKFYREGRVKDFTEVVKKLSLRDAIRMYDYFNQKYFDATTPDKVTHEFYLIRNGKIHVEPIVEEKRLNADQAKTLKNLCSLKIFQHLQNLQRPFSDKIFVIPDYLEYPAFFSEKQMVGNVPYGTSIALPEGKAITPAIKWKNQNGRVDLDLHLTGLNAAYGWNQQFYNTHSYNVHFSGDLVDAPHGAVEAYWIEREDGVGRKNPEMYTLSVHNYRSSKDVNYSFVLTTNDCDHWSDDGMVDIDNVYGTPVPLHLKNEGDHATLGLISPEDNKFYFYGGALGAKIRLVPDISMSRQFIKTAIEKVKTRFPLKFILEASGGKIVSSVAEAQEYIKEYGKDFEIVDLSLDKLTPTSFSALFKILEE